MSDQSFSILCKFDKAAHQMEVVPLMCWSLNSSNGDVGSWRSWWREAGTSVALCFRIWRGIFDVRDVSISSPGPCQRWNWAVSQLACSKKNQKLECASMPPSVCEVFWFHQRLNLKSRFFQGTFLLEGFDIMQVELDTVSCVHQVTLKLNPSLEK